jgi:glycosyltransferase involved in cell wall biosynthesis
MGHECSPVPGLVSIIVPCYNAERFLGETLVSAFAQSYKNTEIIIVDDGSTDGTAELIRSYGNLVRGEFGPNRGVSAARNRGTSLARGEFVQYLDADDLLTENAIERRVAALQTSGADIAYSDWERLIESDAGMFEVGEKIVRRIEELDPDSGAAYLYFWAPLAALTYRRTIVDSIGGWKEWLPIIQDARFLHDAGLAGGRFIHVTGVGAQYREHRSVRLSRRGGGSFAADCLRNASELQTIFANRGGMSPGERRFLARTYAYAARSLFFQDKVAFRVCIGRLYEVEPSFRLSWPKTVSLVSDLIGFGAASTFLTILKDCRSALRALSVARIFDK